MFDQLVKHDKYIDLVVEKRDALDLNVVELVEAEEGLDRRADRAGHFPQTVGQMCHVIQFIN